MLRFLEDHGSKEYIIWGVGNHFKLILLFYRESGLSWHLFWKIPNFTIIRTSFFMQIVLTLSSLTKEQVRASRRRRVASLVAARSVVLGGGMARRTVMGGLRAESNCATTQPINGSHKCTTESQDAAIRNDSRNVMARTVLRWPEYVHWHCVTALPSPCSDWMPKLWWNTF